MSQSETLLRKHERLVATCDAWIRQGRIGDVVTLVSELNFAQVPRIHRQSLAKIARRCGLVERGLLLLYPIIRNEKPLETPPTPSEICEYAVLLSRNGSVPEALALLSGVDARLAPEKLLYEGFCHISSWDYARAKPSLESFLEASADEYSKLIARVNLAACYVVLESDSMTEKFITETLEMAIARGAARLQGNLLELRAQFHLARGQFDRALADLDRARAIFGDSQSYDQLLIDKWHALIEANRTGTTNPLTRFRELAEARGFWEFVRDADLMCSKMAFDQKAFDHLVHGTPNEAYRERIRAQLPNEPSESYVWGDEKGLRLDLETGLYGSSKLNAGKKIHQAIVALMRDFYVPRGTGSLFAEIYPDEIFNVHTSNLKIRQLLKRTREWFEKAGVPLAIEHRERGYRLVRTGDVGIELKLNRLVSNSEGCRLLELTRRFGHGEPFSTSQACEVLQMSRSSLHRLVDSLVESGKVTRIGQGKATKYRVA